MIGSSTFLAFLTNTCPSIKDTRWAIFCLSPSGILPKCLYQTKSISRPTYSHWILTFYSSMESLLQRQADCTICAKKFCIDFGQMPLNGICTFSFFLEFTDRVKKNFKCFCTFEFAWSRAFQKCKIRWNLRNFFAHYLLNN